MPNQLFDKLILKSQLALIIVGIHSTALSAFSVLIFLNASAHYNAHLPA